MFIPGFISKHKKWLISALILALASIIGKIAEISIGFDLNGDKTADLYLINKNGKNGLDTNGDREIDVLLN